MQVILIILIIVLTIILFGVNFYLLILYIHPDDKGLGQVIYTKILVLLGLTLAQAQALMVPLDVANKSALFSTDKLDMTAFWYIIYIVILIFIVLLIPYAIFFYESDPDDGICCRLLKSFGYTMISIVITIVILFITWAFFKFVDLPYQDIQLGYQFQQNGPININTVIENAKSFSNSFTIETSFAVYIIAILSFFGWFFFVIFGGVGLFALPMDMINQFRHRPQPKKSEEMRKIKQKMCSVISTMIQQGEELKKLESQAEKNSQAGWLQRFKNNRDKGQKFTQFKAKYHQLDKQFKTFNMELTYSDTNPIIPVLKLILGIIFVITSILWIIQIIFGNLAKKDSERPLIPFFNELFIYLENRNAGFISTAIFAYLVLYLVWCVQKGNIKFGIRIPCCCRFHPMKQNQTWMNSFLFNVILLLISSVGVIQLSISSFPTFTRNAQIYLIFGIQVKYMRFYTFFYKNGVFPILLLIWSGITFIYMLATCNRKPKYMKQIQRIRNQE